MTGVILVLVGWYLLTHTAITTLLLVQVLGLYWLIAGVVDVIGSLVSKSQANRGWRLAGGLLGIIAGLVVINSPVSTAIFTVTMLTYFIAFTFIFGGATKIFIGRQVDGNKYKWSFGSLILGVAYVLVGVAILGNTLLSAVALLYTLGFLTLIGGVATIIAAFIFKDELD